jgi:hypothetical protein
MGDLISLRRARKQKARLVAAQESAERRAAFGISRAEREAADRAMTLEAKRLEAHRRDVPPRDDPA